MATDDQGAMDTDESSSVLGTILKKCRKCGTREAASVRRGQRGQGIAVPPRSRQPQFKNGGAAQSSRGGGSSRTDGSL